MYVQCLNDWNKYVSQKRSILHLCLYYQFTAVKTGSRQRLGVWRAERSFASSQSHSLNNHAVGVRLELRCRRTRRDSSNSVHASSEHSSCAVALVSGLVAVVGSHRWKPRLLPLPRRTCERAVSLSRRYGTAWRCMRRLSYVCNKRQRVNTAHDSTITDGQGAKFHNNYSRLWLEAAR